MYTQLIDIDPLSGIETWHHYDPLTDVTTIEERQDVEPWLEWCKSIANTDYSMSGIKKSWWHVAEIPNVIQMKWLREEGVDIWNKDHWQAVKRKLNDPDYKYFRTGSHRV